MSFLDRVGSAPISWGVCEVPGWGAQLPVERVLSEMRQVGLTATELGSIGYLPTDSAELRALLDRYELRLTGGFVALTIADPDRVDETLDHARADADLLAGGGADYFVTCAVSDVDDWARPELSDAQWQLMVDQIARIGEICTERGLKQVFHPHVDSLVETGFEIERLFESSDVDFVLETGHMMIGGFDPLAFARQHADRVGLVHLKDVAVDLIAPLNNDELTLMQAVQAGLFPSLGAGGAPLAGAIAALESSGYDGWYIIEQDAAITDGFPSDGDGPIRDVIQSVAYLRSIESSIGSDFTSDNKGEVPV
jgi:inosose dehydratase